MSNADRPFYFEADTFDSRDVIARIDQLEGIEVIDRTPDEQDELDDLYALQYDVDGGEWKDGMTFIAKHYFEDYAEELAYEIGALDSEAVWPTNCIDWAEAADQLAMDYTEFKLRGETYYARA